MLNKGYLCFVLFVLSLLLASCTLVPSYERPEMPVPLQFPGGDDDNKAQFGEGDRQISELPWREFFSDPLLVKVIEISLENNRNLRLAVQRLTRMRALYRIQQAELLPTVDASGNYIRQRQSGELIEVENSRIAEQSSLNIGITSWEVDFFGRVQSLSEAALEEYLATEEAKRAAQIALIAECAQSYLQYAADRENLQLASLTLKAQEEAFKLIQRRFEVGLVAELDLRLVQTRVDAARVDLARYTELLARDKNALDLLAGSTVPDELLPTALRTVLPLAEIAPGLSSAVLLQRPDVLGAEHMLKAANANIGAARAVLFPRIELTSTIGRASTELGELFEPGNRVWLFAPRVEMPIFDARSWIALDVTEVDREIAKTQYELTVQNAFREVADVLAQKANLAEQMSAQQSLVENTAESYRLSNARYDKGVDIFLNVLDAQRSLYAAEQGLIAIRLAKLSNQVKLYAVLGGGWY